MSQPEPSLKQITRFLSLLEQMTPETRQAFHKIYELAPKAGQARSTFTVGHHVRVAMVEALTHPHIAYWVKMNLALRVTRKLAQTTGQTEKAERLTSLLEAFHVAVDAFLFDLTIEQALRHRARSRSAAGGQVIPFPATVALSGPFVSDEDIRQIQTFKQTLIPGFIQAIRRKTFASSYEETVGGYASTEPKEVIGQI
jgi:hypothetical protein